jgi:stage III sporulation protein SpoIIIAA
LGNFNNDNRAGIARTLHRISCLKNSKGNIIGLTCRVGRAIFGTISIIRDLVESEQSILIVGRPGVGKTTIIREIAKILSDEMEKRVVIVDNSNEITGDSDIPHFGIGKSRRLQLSKSQFQYNLMIEAVENHMPEFIIVDEIGTELEVLSARTIAERGVRLIGTAHGNSLENLIKNPILTDIVGGVQNVILSDEEAKRRGTQKNILERKISPTFQLVIEINQKEKWLIYENVEQFVDFFLKKQNPFLQFRILEKNNKALIYQKTFEESKKEINLIKQKETNVIIKSTDLLKNSSNNFKTKIYIYCYSISINKIQQICKSVGINPIFIKNVNEATVIFALKSYLKENKKLKQIARVKKIPLYVIKKNNYNQIGKIIFVVTK